MQLNSRIKKLLIALGVIGVIAIGAGLFMYYKNSLTFEPHGQLTVISIPFELTLSDETKNWTRDINTEAIEGTTLPVHAGVRSITFSAEGFTSETRELTIEEGETQTVYIILDPATDEAAEEIANEEKYGQRREDIAGHEVAAGGEALGREHPIVNKLPILDQWFEVFACNGLQQEALEPDEIGICVNLALDNQTQRDNAMAAIESTGEYDATKYKVLMNGVPYTP